MDDTTRRDLTLPNFDSPSWQWTRRDAGEQGASRTGAGPLRRAERTQQRESTATEMTFASKLPPDHPGLRLDRPHGRTLKKGPIVVTATILTLSVLIAAAIAFSPKNDDARAATPPLPDAPSKGVNIAEAVENAPGNEAGLHGAPRLGPPLKGADPAEGTIPPAPAGAASAGQSRRASLREEQAKALSSPILADLENPLAAEERPSGLAGALGVPSATPQGSQAPAPATAFTAGTPDLNMQEHKNQFLKRDGADDSDYLSHPISSPRSPYEVKAGTIIPATLITGINSDLPGQIVGQVRENVFDTVSGDHLLIPQGSRLIATYDSAVSFGQERILVCWNRLIRPDGISIALECMPGVDLAGYSGFADQVDHHWWRIITGVALGTFLSATAEHSQGNVSGYAPTVPQLWASNAGGALNQAAEQITQKNLGIQPTLKVRPGYTVNVLVTKDIVLVPINQ